MKHNNNNAMDLAERTFEAHTRLLDFYGYPQWRNPLPPLDELVSTILSQNTNDVHRDRAFEALTARFSTWESVRDAEEQEVIEAIRTAGLANPTGARIPAVLRSRPEHPGSPHLAFLHHFPTAAAPPQPLPCPAAAVGIPARPAFDIWLRYRLLAFQRIISGGFHIVVACEARSIHRRNSLARW